MKIALFDSEYRNRNRYIIHAITAAMKRTSGIEKVWSLQHSSREPNASEADVIVFFGGAQNVFWRAAHWRDSGKIVVLWTTEDPYEIENNLKFAEHFDLILSNDLESVERYRGLAEHLPLGGCTDQHLYDVRQPNDLLYDILFVGTAWPNRVDDINRILKHFRGAKLKIGLPGNPHIPVPKLDTGDLFFDWRCSPQAFARLANKSKVTLALGRTYSGSKAALNGSTPPPRIFELALAGTAQVFVSSSLELSRYFDTDHEIVLTDTVEKAVPIIQSIVSSESLRKNLATNAQRRAALEHTYDHRVERLLGAINKIMSVRARGSRIERECSDSSTRSRILFVAHNLEGKAPGGGVEAYISMLAPLLRNRMEMFIIVPERLGTRTILHLTLPDNICVRYETRCIYSNEYISSPEIEEIIFRIIVENGIELVHFHHLLGLPLSLPAVAATAGAKVVFTAHDYYLICDNYCLINPENRFCRFLEFSRTICDVCLSRGKGLPAGSQAKRRNTVQAIMESIDLFIFNTEYSRSMFLDVYSLDAARTRVVEMLTPTERCVYAEDPSDAASNRRPLRVKVPGNFTREKGAANAVAVMEIMKEENIHFHVLGHEDDSARKALDECGSSNVRRGKGYRRADLPFLLHEGDVALQVSIWPETYMISLSESWSAGLVPIVSNLGAPAERVTHGVDGFIVSPDDPGRTAEILRSLYEQPDLLRRMKRTIAEKHLCKPREHFDKLICEYSGLMSRDDAPRAVLAASTGRVVYDRAMLGTRFTSNRWTDPQTLWDSEYDSKGLSQCHDVEEVPVFPLSDVPMKYRHLKRIQGDAAGRVIVELAGDGGVIVKSEPDKEYIGAFLRLHQGGVSLFLEPAAQEKERRGSRVAFQIPASLRHSAVDFVVVYDGLIVEHRDIICCQKLNELVSVDASWKEGVVLVEGCDSLEARVDGGVVHLSFAGLDPRHPQRSCPGYLLFEGPSGSAAIVELEAHSKPRGGKWKARVDLQEFALLAGDAAENVTVCAVQLSGTERISSGLLWRLFPLNTRPPERTLRPDLAEALVGALESHERESRPSPEDLLHEALTIAVHFDSHTYIHSCGDRLAIKELQAIISHYIRSGEALNYRPAPGFIPDVYREANPEIVSHYGVGRLFGHYMSFGRFEGRRASLGGGHISDEAKDIVGHLDKSYYKSVAFGGELFSGHLEQHYVAFGEPNDIPPNKWFDPGYYRAHNPDVAQAGLCLFAHYLKFGREEGRVASPEHGIKSKHLIKKEIVSAHFDLLFYLDQLPGIRGTGVDPVCHFFEHGARAGASPNRRFRERGVPMNPEDFMRWCREQGV